MHIFYAVAFDRWYSARADSSTNRGSQMEREQKTHNTTQTLTIEKNVVFVHMLRWIFLSFSNKKSLHTFRSSSAFYGFWVIKK